jgi:hypothetical protein
MTTRARWGWRILVTVGALLMMNGLGLYAFIVDTHVEQTIGVLLAAFGALAAASALDGLRHDGAHARHTGWVVVIALVAIAAHTLQGDRMDVPLTYLALGGIALLGQLLTRGPVRS